MEAKYLEIQAELNERQAQSLVSFTKIRLDEGVAINPLGKDPTFHIFGCSYHTFGIGSPQHV